MSISLHKIVWRSCILNPHIRTWQLGFLIGLYCAELMSWWVYSLLCLSFSSKCLFLSLSLCLSLSVCLCVSLFVARSSTYTDTVRLQGRLQHQPSGKYFGTNELFIFISHFSCVSAWLCIRLLIQHKHKCILTLLVFILLSPHALNAEINLYDKVLKHCHVA